MAFSHSAGLRGVFKALFVVYTVGSATRIVLVHEVVIVIIHAVCTIADDSVFTGEKAILIVCNIEEADDQYEYDANVNGPSGR